MGEANRERPWLAVASRAYLDLARGLCDVPAALEAVADALAREGISIVCFPDPPSDPVRPGVHRVTLRGGAGQAAGVLELPAELPSSDAQGIADVFALLLDHPVRVSMPRTLAHDLANKLAAILANAELVEWLARQPHEDTVTIHEAARGCLAVTRELIATVEVLQSQRKR
jgi:hypothetical protein